MQSPVARLSILLLEDNSDDVFFFLRSAVKLGVDAVHVSDGDIARKLLTRDEHSGSDHASALPSIIVTDLKMPHCDGIEFVKWLRSQPMTKTLPIIVLSSSPRPDDKERALAAGANGYLIKPCDPLEDEALLDAIVSAATSPSGGVPTEGYHFPERKNWMELARKVVTAIQAAPAQGQPKYATSPAQRMRWEEVVSTLLYNEELDGRLYRGPGPES